MARDIEEFLRKAAERRRQQQQKKQRAPERPQRVREIIRDAEVVEPDIVYSEEVKPKPRPKPRQAEKSKPRTLVKKDMWQQSVSEHVRTHIDSTDIASHADHLGDRIQDVDDQVAARIKRKFNHDVGHLDELPSVQDDKVATVTKENVSHIAADLIKMLRSPNSVRQAIMISEILKRPNFDD